jgi:flagellar basal-body rod protein FlgF
MENVTTIAISRLTASQRAMDVTATNIANASTPGFRAERVQFSDWLLRSRNGERTSYVQDRATYRDNRAGQISRTGNPLDLALPDENAWFTVQTSAGPRLTRAGRFSIAANGRVVDEDGDALLDNTGRPLQLAATDTGITVAADGSLSTEESGPIGRIGVVSVTDEARMQAQGDRNLAAASPTRPVAQPRIVQGALESSNVQPIGEITRMTNDLRTFQFVTQLVQAESDRQQTVIDKLAPKQS